MRPQFPRSEISSISGSGMNVGNICWRWLLVRAMPSGGLATTTTWPTIAIMRNLPIKFRQSTRLPGGLASRWKGGHAPAAQAGTQGYGTAQTDRAASVRHSLSLSVAPPARSRAVQKHQGRGLPRHALTCEGKVCMLAFAQHNDDEALTRDSRYINKQKTGA